MKKIILPTWTVDKKGFDLLGKVPSEEEARDEYQWRELRF